jgi:hypothetical protein
VTLKVDKTEVGHRSGSETGSVNSSNPKIGINQKDPNLAYEDDDDDDGFQNHGLFRL